MEVRTTVLSVEQEKEQLRIAIEEEKMQSEYVHYKTLCIECVCACVYVCKCVCLCVCMCVYVCVGVSVCTYVQMLYDVCSLH